MSFRRKEVLPGPHKVGPSSYSVDFCPKPLRKRTPPRVREGNILNSYPGNVLYPYKLPEEVREMYSYIWEILFLPHWWENACTWSLVLVMSQALAFLRRRVTSSKTIVPVYFCGQDLAKIAKGLGKCQLQDLFSFFLFDNPPWPNCFLLFTLNSVVPKQVHFHGKPFWLCPTA